MMFFKESNMLISISALKAACLCVADNRDIRKYLQNVYVSDVNVVGTNGHYGFIKDESVNENATHKFEGTLEPKKLNEFLKTVSKDEMYVEAEMLANTIWLTSKNKNGEGIAQPFENQGGYVEFNRAFPKKINSNAIDSIQLNLDYVEVLNKVNKVLRKSKADQPILNFTGYGNVVVAEWKNDVTCRFYVMPIKH